MSDIVEELQRSLVKSALKRSPFHSYEAAYPMKSIDEDEGDSEDFNNPRTLNDAIDRDHKQHENVIREMFVTHCDIEKHPTAADAEKEYVRFIKQIRYRRDVHLCASHAYVRLKQLASEFDNAKLPIHHEDISELSPTIVNESSTSASYIAVKRRLLTMELDKLTNRADALKEMLYSGEQEKFNAALMEVSKGIDQRLALYKRFFAQPDGKGEYDLHVSRKIEEFQNYDDRIRIIDAAVQAAAPRTCDPDDSDYDDDLGYVATTVVQSLEHDVFGEELEIGELPVAGAERRKREEAELFSNLPSLMRTGTIIDELSPKRTTLRMTKRDL